MERFDLLLDLLKASLKKNGDKEITISYLLNVMEMVNRKSGELSEQLYKDCLDIIKDD